jgi:predicted O-methyltransferase YrrM
LRDWLRSVRKTVRGKLMIDRGIDAIARWPITILIGVIRRAPARSRIEVFRSATRGFAPLGGKVVERCKIKSLDEFESAYGRLAEMLGYVGKTPPAGELAFLAAIAKRRTYYPGTIGPADYLFLTAFVSILAPRRVVEIGTLTGFSAGVIAAALARQHGQDGTSWVDTIDNHAECAIDRKRRTGFEIAEFFSDIASMIRLYTPRDATFVAQLAKRAGLELAFIDADHRHPLPLLDLLRLAPYMQSTAWILLHDIQLGTMTRKTLEAGRKTAFEPVYGAEWLFNRWPFRKISRGNIGAVQLPENKTALLPFALRMMSIQFETAGKMAPAVRRALYESLDELISGRGAV